MDSGESKVLAYKGALKDVHLGTILVRGAYIPDETYRLRMNRRQILEQPRDNLEKPRTKRLFNGRPYEPDIMTAPSLNWKSKGRCPPTSANRKGDTYKYGMDLHALRRMGEASHAMYASNPEMLGLRNASTYDETNRLVDYDAVEYGGSIFRTRPPRSYSVAYSAESSSGAHTNVLCTVGKFLGTLPNHSQIDYNRPQASISHSVASLSDPANDRAGAIPHAGPLARTESSDMHAATSMRGRDDALRNREASSRRANIPASNHQDRATERPMTTGSTNTKRPTSFGQLHSSTIRIHSAKTNSSEPGPFRNTLLPQVGLDSTANFGNPMEQGAVTSRLAETIRKKSRLKKTLIEGHSRALAIPTVQEHKLDRENPLGIPTSKVRRFEGSTYGYTGSGTYMRTDWQTLEQQEEDRLGRTATATASEKTHNGLSVSGLSRYPTSRPGSVHANMMYHAPKVDHGPLNLLEENLVPDPLHSVPAGQNNFPALQQGNFRKTYTDIHNVHVLSQSLLGRTQQLADTEFLQQSYPDDFPYAIENESYLRGQRRGRRITDVHMPPMYRQHALGKEGTLETLREMGPPMSELSIHPPNPPLPTHLVGTARRQGNMRIGHAIPVRQDLPEPFVAIRRAINYHRTADELHALDPTSQTAAATTPSAAAATERSGNRPATALGQLQSTASFLAYDAATSPRREPLSSLQNSVHSRPHTSHSMRQQYSTASVENFPKRTCLSLSAAKAKLQDLALKQSQRI